MSVPRPEYPRPQFQRREWLNLNGIWRFDFDDQDAGLRERWFAEPPLRREIMVPFTFQAPLSGIHTNAFHDVAWYARTFDLPAAWASQRIMLHFGAVDYRAWVWVNGTFAAYHEGGHTPFSTDVTALVTPGSNHLVVRVEDVTADLYQPRGKQYWEAESASIFYTRTTGIWQSVWLEPVSPAHLASMRITPLLESEQVFVVYTLDRAAEGLELETTIAFEGDVLLRETMPITAPYAEQTYPIPTPHRWSPESPALYDITVRVMQDGTAHDEVQGYFGMRQISIRDGRLLLNGKPYYMRLALDQGYHPDGILTFPTDEDFQRDITITRALGFNGVRKHQKIEDPRYLHWADKMGVLVWGEMANAYAFSDRAVRRVTAEWQDAVVRDYNHPCIVAWVPLNESWGVPALQTDARQRDHLTSLYHLTRARDPTRPVISNDGWEHTRSDLLTIHDYEGNGETLRERYRTRASILSARPARRDLFAPGHAYEGQPIIVSEFGGIAYKLGGASGWGYTTAEDEADFIRRYEAVVSAVLESPEVQGFCYTQLTDVEQEINGLLTYDRQPKVNPAAIRRINLGLPQEAG
jgi:beta-galactosidase/beta-glucuronidase